MTTDEDDLGGGDGSLIVSERTLRRIKIIDGMKAAAKIVKEQNLRDEHDRPVQVTPLNYEMLLQGEAPPKKRKIVRRQVPSKALPDGSVGEPAAAPRKPIRRLKRRSG